jgi:hypothetical protein
MAPPYAPLDPPNRAAASVYRLDGNIRIFSLAGERTSTKKLRSWLAVG